MNQCIFSGRLVRDPELRYVPNTGTAITRFKLAVDRKLSVAKKNELKAQGKPTADFPSFIAFDKIGELCANSLAKGSKVNIESTFQSGSYKTPSGETVYTNDFLVNGIEFLSSKKTDGSEPEAQSGYEQIEDDDMPF